MRRTKHLRLSLYTVPELAVGQVPLNPENSGTDPRRLHYLEGMVVYLNSLFRDAAAREPRETTLARVRRLLSELPHSELVILDPEHDPPVAEHPSARDRIGFDHERLKLVFLDGLNRGSQSPSIAMGGDSPQLARAVAELAHGISESSLPAFCARAGVDLSGAVSGLREFGLIEAEAVPHPPRSAPSLDGRHDRLSWLGHACVLFQTHHTSLCVDPFLRPHIRWKQTDIDTVFSDEFGERLYFEPYGPTGRQLSPLELPPLDAVFITHQDIDHCNLGVLMTLPQEVPIVVPDWHPGRPWEVDLAELIRRVLGEERKVVRLKHRETLRFGDVEVTAFPFRAEMPASLETSWNCYLFETASSAVACTADSAATDECVDFLIRRLGRRKPLVLCSRPFHSGAFSPGYRDETDQLFNFTRLWAWYLPVWDLFQAVEQPGISESRLERLAAGTDLRVFLPYAMGTAPWYRIRDEHDPLRVPLGNLSIGELHGMADTLKSMPHAPLLFPGKFAEPLRIDML